MRVLIVLWLIIVSDGVGALIGARAAWQMRDKDKRRPELAIAFAFGLGCYAVSAFGSTYNSILNGSLIKYPEHFLKLAIAFRCLQTIGVWVVALTLMNGHTPGIVRRNLSRALSRLK